MASFSYKAADKNNRIITGTIAAPNEKEASSEITKLDLKPISIKSVERSKASQSEVPAIDLITFCRYVSTMLQAGLSLTEGLAVLKGETKQPVMKQILDDILYNLERGNSLSKAMELYPLVFTPFFLALVKAGEVSGTMGSSFKFLEIQLRSEYSLSQKIKGALLYPGVVFVAMTGIGALMVFVIMPQIGKVFLSMTIPLPEFTKFIFRTSLALAAIKGQIIVGGILGVIGLSIFIKQPLGKKVVLAALTPLPLIKHLLEELDIARFCRIFATLTAAAVPVTDSLQIALTSLTDPRFHKLCPTIVKQVMEGKTVAESFKIHNVFPPLLTQMIAGGEQSGTLDKTLGDLASFYEEEVEEAVKKATQLLEPILMLIVGIGVGAMILSIIAPMYSVVGSLQAK